MPSLSTSVVLNRCALTSNLINRASGFRNGERSVSISILIFISALRTCQSIAYASSVVGKVKTDLALFPAPFGLAE
jgi:hypothetical protein